MFVLLINNYSYDLVGQTLSPLALIHNLLIVVLLDGPYVSHVMQTHLH